MASELRVTTIANNAGTESVNTTYVVNGSAKAWVNADGSTAAIKDSFNGSSITDRGAAQFTISWTNATSDANYAITGTMNFDSVNGTGFHSAPSNTAIGTWKTTTSNQCDFYYGNNSRHGADPHDIANVIHGDLA
jgi:hypothetical protein